MHYQIFIPGGRGQNPQQLVDVGLADLVAGAEFMDVAKGPDGKAGGVVAWRRPGQAQMGYQAGIQEWIPAAPREDLSLGRYWVGFWNDSPATSKELSRPYPQPGRRVALGDSQEWLIPAAKELDADMVLADDGTWKFEVQRRFHSFYLEYLRWFQFFATAKDGDAFDFAEAAEFVLLGLRTNYRLVPEAASHLRLFTKETVTQALFGIIGVDPGAWGVPE